MPNLDLGFRFFAQDLASGTITQMKLRVEDLNAVVARSGQKFAEATGAAKIGMGDLLTASLGFGLVGAGFFSAAMKAGEFDRQIRFLAITSGATRSELENFRGLILRTAMDLGLSAVETAKAAVAITRLGFSGAEAAKVLEPSLKLVVAAMGELDPDKAGKLVGQTLRSFGLGADKASVVAEQMAAAVNASALDFKKLGLAMGTTGGFAANFGASTSELLALLGLTRDVIERTERGATGIRNIFRDLTKAKVQDRLAQADLNVTVLTGAGNFRNILDIIRDVHRAVGGLTDAQRLQLLQQTFSIESATVLASLFKRVESGVTGLDGKLHTGAAGFAAIEERIRSSSGLLEQFKDAALGPLPGQMALTTAAFDQLAIGLGAVFGIILGPALTAVTAGLRGLIGLFTQTGFVGKSLALVLGISAGALGILAPLLLTAGFLMRTYALFTSLATIASGGFFTTLITGIKALLRTTVILGLISVVVGGLMDLFGAFGSTTDAAFAAGSALPAPIQKSGLGAALPPMSPASYAGNEALIESLNSGEGLNGEEMRGIRSGSGAGGSTGEHTLRNNIYINLDGKKIADAVNDVNLREARRTFQGNR